MIDMAFIQLDKYEIFHPLDTLVVEELFVKYGPFSQITFDIYTRTFSDKSSDMFLYYPNRISESKIREAIEIVVHRVKSLTLEDLKNLWLEIDKVKNG